MYQLVVKFRDCTTKRVVTVDHVVRWSVIGGGGGGGYLKFFNSLAGCCCLPLPSAASPRLASAVPTCVKVIVERRRRRWFVRELREFLFLVLAIRELSGDPILFFFYEKGGWAYLRFIGVCFEYKPNSVIRTTDG